MVTKLEKRPTVTRVNEPSQAVLDRWYQACINAVKRAAREGRLKGPQ